MSDKTKIIISIIVGISFVLGAITLGCYFNKAKGPVKTVSVVGLAERDFVSDLIVWDFNYKTKDMNQKAAYDQIKKMNETVKAYLISKGIPENEIQFKRTQCEESYRYEYSREAQRSFDVFQGYEMTQNVRIESKDVEKVENLYKDIAELLDEGINVNTWGPNYYYTKLADLKIEMLAEATKDARNRAETITKNAGTQIAGLKVANMGVFQITAPNSSDEDYSWGGAFNTSSKNKRASINMRLTYFVK